MIIPTQQFLLFFQNTTTRRNFYTLAKFFILLFLLVIFYSVLFHLLMLYEGREYSWVTGVYWSLTVMSTLGFGDITFHTDLGLLFTLVVLISGILFMLIILPFTFIQFFYAPWLKIQTSARTPRKLPDETKGHVIVAGLNPVAWKLIKQFQKKKYPYVVLAPDLPTATELYEKGYKVIVGEVDDPHTYTNVHVGKASMVVAIVDDLINTNISFTVREICENVPIVTNADKDHSVDILQYPGNMHVFQFMKMLGEALAQRTLGLDDPINIVASYDGLQIGVAPALRSSMVGTKLFQSGMREETGVTVVGVWEKGILKLPSPETMINQSSVLVLAGAANQLDRFAKTYSDPRKNIDKDAPVLILGGGRVGQATAESLKKAGVNYKIVEKRSNLASEDDIYIHGDAADLDTLKRAGIETARSVIITTHNDDMNIYLTFYCRQLRNDIQILSRANIERNVSKLHRAGANLVMSYASMAAGAILNILMPGEISVFTDGLVVFNTPVPDKVVDKNIIESKIRAKTGCSIVALRQGKKLQVGPDPKTVLPAGTELILVGTDEAEKRYISFVEG